MRISDWSSDVCSSDLLMAALQMRKEFKKGWFRLVGTVHDAVLVEVREDKVEYVYNRILEIMSQPELLQDFDIHLNVPIEAEAKIGRASCRERVWQYVSIWVIAV